MLILVAGGTGKMGEGLVRSALARNHRVRILARNPEKLPESIRDRLESVITVKAYDDVAALDQACAGGVDAVICAYTGQPYLQLDCQLLLLRAAERAHIRKYVADSWNYDWRTLTLGQHESYDPFLCFRRQVELTSSIKPVYIFTGVLAEVLFSSFFTTTHNGIWDAENKSIATFGTGDEVWHITTYADAAEYTIEILQLPEIEDGGFFSVASCVHSTKELARRYGAVRNLEVSIKLQGTVEELKRIAFAARQEGDVRKFYEYIGWFYQLYTLDGTWVMKDLDNDRFPGVNRTSLEKFLSDNPKL